jgi:hypothetical protein
MSRPALRALMLLVLVMFALVALSGCTNPDAPSATSGAAQANSPQNTGELPAPAPPSSQAQTPAGVQTTPAAAVEAFARLYVNWTYRTLTSHQRRLAAMSVGPARLAEQQAAAASRADTTIARGHIYNTGQIVSVAPEPSHTRTWVIVTREQTGGSSEYQGLAAAYHVTLAKLAHIPQGYVVESWLPQS